MTGVNKEINLLKSVQGILPKLKPRCQVADQETNG